MFKRTVLGLSISILVFSAKAGIWENIKSYKDNISTKVSSWWNKKENKITKQKPAFDPNADLDGEEYADYFNTKLSREKVREKLLTEDNFKAVNFTTYRKTDDNFEEYKLEGFFRKVDNAKATIVICNGWMPGVPENMIPLIPMIAEDYNILLFGQLGRGNSEGKLKSYWHEALRGHYGEQNWHDIVAALNFAAENGDGVPQMIIATCSGAFNAAHALLKLNNEKHFKEDLQNYSNYKKIAVKGLVFDSGWSDVNNVAKCILNCQISKALKGGYLEKVVSGVVFGVKSLLADKNLKANSAKMSLKGQMKNLKTPVLFIHSSGDEMAPIDPVKELFNEQKDAICFKSFDWFVDIKDHGNLMLKEKKEYRNQICKFMQYCLQCGKAVDAIRLQLR